MDRISDSGSDDRSSNLLGFTFPKANAFLALAFLFITSLIYSLLMPIVLLVLEGIKNRFLNISIISKNKK